MMDYQNNLIQLLRIVNYNDSTNKIRMNFNDEYKFLPFKTRNPDRPRYDEGFKRIIGEYSRIINNVALDSNFDNDLLLSGILESDKIDVNSEDRLYLNELIQEYLFDNDQIMISHPYLYQYVIPADDKSKGGEVDVARFLSDVFRYDDFSLQSFFNYEADDEFNNILSKLIIENLPKLNEKTINSVYVPKLNYIQDIFKEDMIFALKNKKFLNKNIENIFAYYYFFYITQFSQKLFNEENNLDQCIPLYYLLDNENVSKNRKTISNGYRTLKDNNRNLLYKIYTLDYVNKLLGTRGLVFSELIEHFENLDEDSQSGFIHVLKEFINIYNKINERFVTIDTDDFKDLFKMLYGNFLNIKDQSPSSRYSLCIEDIGKKYFLKLRGQYGYVLNINQDMLLTITALCVKTDKMKLKDLFVEYEKRGIFFDNKSKREVEFMLTKLNCIDKKSDSGDAQYVRRIL